MVKLNKKEKEIIKYHLRVIGEIFLGVILFFIGLFILVYFIIPLAFSISKLFIGLIGLYSLIDIKLKFFGAVILLFIYLKIFEYFIYFLQLLIKFIIKLISGNENSNSIKRKAIKS